MKLVVGLGLLGLLVGGGWWMWGQREWLGEERFTVVNFSEEVTVESFDPATKKGIRLVIPGNLEVDGVGGRGSWRAEVLEKAGREWGTGWAADSLADYLGIGYTGVAGRMNWLDELRWWWEGRKVNWETVELGKTRWVTEVTDPDGVKLGRLAERWPEKAKEWFFSVNMSLAELNVEVVNTTGVPGLGSHVARMLENAGLRVIGVKNYTEEVGECEVRGREENKEALVSRWVMKQLKCQWREGGSETGDIQIVVGEEYRKWWRGS